MFIQVKKTSFHLLYNEIQQQCQFSIFYFMVHLNSYSDKLIPYFHKYLFIVSVLELEFNFPLQFAIVFFQDPKVRHHFLLTVGKWRAKEFGKWPKGSLDLKQLKNNCQMKSLLHTRCRSILLSKLKPNLSGRYSCTYVTLCFAYLYKYNPEEIKTLCC